MKQQGMALIVALVITVIIGIIAVAIGRSALQNQQSASSQYDMLRSYTAAQSAINRAERLLSKPLLTMRREFSASIRTLSAQL